jgi:hypothetical protein
MRVFHLDAPQTDLPGSLTGAFMACHHMRYQHRCLIADRMRLPTHCTGPGTLTFNLLIKAVTSRKWDTGFPGRT